MLPWHGTATTDTATDHESMSMGQRRRRRQATTNRWVWDSDDGDGNPPRIDGYGTVTTETATHHESTAPVHRTQFLLLFKYSRPNRHSPSCYWFLILSKSRFSPQFNSLKKRFSPPLFLAARN
ncbi:hypothetical protein Zmor_014392 [Zophobas morio]|uniref:Uncharacterized protein n=1 Tax=Zophobas morio TaxID=2755281 RepID=A0AA38IJJ5_9CUCU|nr:hypothetical protein Zmor_014392 [Zophobas morio]